MCREFVYNCLKQAHKLKTEVEPKFWYNMWSAINK